MRTPRALAAAVAAGALVGLAAPAAVAISSGPGNIVVLPSVTTKKATLTVTVHAASCRTGATVESKAFPRTDLEAIEGGDTAHATAVVRDTVAPGQYDVTVTCPGGSPVVRPAAFTVIHGGVRGGLGAANANGATSADLIIGGVLVTSALVGGAVLYLRRRSDGPV